MGPLEKFKAFGLSAKDIPVALSGLGEMMSSNWDKHESLYNQAAEDMKRQYGGLTPEYNYAKGVFGGMDYGMRTDRPQSEAEKLARFHQWFQSITRDPTQDLLDLEANLKGLAVGYKSRGKLKPTTGPITDPENYWNLINKAKEITAK